MAATLCMNCRMIDLDLHGEKALTKLLEEESDLRKDKSKGELRNVEIVDGTGKRMLMADADGLLVSRSVTPDLIERQLTFKARDDDIVFAAYPKCGSHWVLEILNMLVEGQTTLQDQYTLKSLEFFPLEVLENLPSPRVLSTHMPFSRVPRDLIARGCKMILVTRNPWDTAVSFFHFLRKLTPFDYHGEWNGFFELFLDGTLPFGSYFDHTHEWLKARASFNNILLVRYEDLHKDFKKEVRRMADFIGKQVSEAMLEAIQRETSFENMLKKKSQSCITRTMTKSGECAIYRKGKCDDWMNYFTEQQSAELHGAYRVSLGNYNHILRYGGRRISTHSFSSDVSDDDRELPRAEQ